jgi:hypothetical protein
VREPVQDGLIEADGAEQLCHPCAARGQHHLLVNDEWFANNVFHIHSWIERTERVLKNDLHSAPQAAHLAVTGGQQIAPFETKSTAAWLD